MRPILSRDAAPAFAMLRGPLRAAFAADSDTFARHQCHAA
jgi:hypothetical protein